MPHDDPIVAAPTQAGPDTVPAAPPTPEPLRDALPRPVLILVLVGLLGFIGVKGVELVGDWFRLQHELERSRQTTIVGYVDITPDLSYANHPTDFVRDEGVHTLIWSGWKHGIGHRWFRVGRGEVDAALLSEPFGRDVYRAIDEPIVEIGGGQRWDKIDDSARIVGIKLGEVPLAYPLRVLAKVAAINDVVNERPILVTYNPRSPEPDSISVFDATLDGARITMGLAGYYHEQRPVYYDRGTESLWVERGESLTALAGARKGATLARIEKPTPVSWGEWIGQFPESRLVVGADRTKGLPTQ